MFYIYRVTILATCIMCFMECSSRVLKTEAKKKKVFHLSLAWFEVLAACLAGYYR